MKSGRSVTVTIERADRSPMNAQRWCLELSCGHEVWVTQKSKPKEGKTVTCKEAHNG